MTSDSSLVPKQGDSSWKAHCQPQAVQSSGAGPIAKGPANVSRPAPHCERNVRPERVNVLAGAGLQRAGLASGQLVAEGLGPEAFIREMLALAHPMEAPPALPKAAGEAYKEQAQNPKTVIRSRMRRLARIEEWSRELEGDRADWAKSLHPDVHAVIGHLHGPLLEKLVRRAGHEDVNYFRSLCAGRPALGELEPAGIYRPSAREAQFTLEEWLRKAPQRNLSIIASVGSSGDTQLDEQAWLKREKEIKTGAVQGPFRVTSVDLTKIAVHPSFPVWERSQAGGWKCRNIDNLKSSGGNFTVSSSEAYTPDDLDAARNAVRMCKELWGPDVVLAGFTSDYSGAFRQSPQAPQMVPYMWSAVWHPHWQEVVLLKNLGQVFGGSGSQMNYVRDPSAMCAIMRYFFDMPMFHYSDDAWCVERHDTASSAWFCWVRVNNLIGWRLDMDKSPHPSSDWRLLGGLLQVGRPNPVAKLPDDKVQLLLQDIDWHLESGRMSPTDAGSMRGRLGWARSYPSCLAVMVQPR